MYMSMHYMYARMHMHRLRHTSAVNTRQISKCAVIHDGYLEGLQVVWVAQRERGLLQRGGQCLDVAIRLGGLLQVVHLRP